MRGLSRLLIVSVGDLFAVGYFSSTEENVFLSSGHLTVITSILEVGRVIGKGFVTIIVEVDGSLISGPNVIFPFLIIFMVVRSRCNSVFPSGEHPRGNGNTSKTYYT